jgi:PEP-CTERM motif
MKSTSIVSLAAGVASLFCLSVAPAVAGTVTGLPLGPAFGPSPQLALSSGTVTNDGTNLDVTLNFSTPISPPAVGAANSVFGYVFLDTDQSAATGQSVNQLNGALGLGLGQIPTGQVPGESPNGILGVDYVVSLDSLGGSVPGDVDVISTTSLLTLVSVPITYTSDSLSFVIPISALTDPVAVNSLVDFGAIVGNPNGLTSTLEGFVATTVPEPSSLTLAGLGFVGLGGFRWARRRGSSRT